MGEMFFEILQIFFQSLTLQCHLTRSVFAPRHLYWLGDLNAVHVRKGENRSRSNFSDSKRPCECTLK